MNFKKMGDTKRWLIEDIAIYAILLVLALAWDSLVNLVTEIGILNLAHEPNGHPFKIGLIQGVSAVFAIIQLSRKISALRYYA